MKSYLPNIGQFSSDLLASCPLSTILKLSSFGQSGEGGSRGLEAKLASNARFRDQGKTLDSGFDNGKSILHPARFLPAPACSLSQLSSLAREATKDSPIRPCADFDLSALGMVNSITARGWHEIFDPASSQIQLKLFCAKNTVNATKAASRISLVENDVTIGDVHKDISSLREFKSAIWSYVIALHFARPWDLSGLIIFSFLQNCNFLESVLTPHHMAAFVDEILSNNRSRFVSDLPPLTVREIESELLAYRSKNFGDSSSTLRRPPSEDRPGQARFRIPKFDSKIRTDFCRRFNSGHCPNKDDTCVIRTNKGMMKLLHQCSVRSPSGTACRKKHPASQHKGGYMNQN